jgi:amino acid adenylation domain-containing protein
MLVLHTARQPTVRLAGLTLEPYPVESGASIAELSLLLEAGDELVGTVEYNAERFAPATIERFGRQLRQLLAAAVAAPDTPIDALPIEDAAPPATAVACGATVDLGPPALLQDLVLAQARRTPRAVAVTDGRATLTYAELVDRAHVLARSLVRAGVGPGAVAAVRLERCTAAVVAPLAVLLAGGVYLPLDPRQPAARNDDIAADAGARVVVTTADGCGPEAIPSRPTVLVDAGTGAPADLRGSPDRLVAPSASPPTVADDRLAYVIATSGSTGRPKLVAVTHRNIVDQVRARQHLAPLGPTDAVLVHTSPGFDPSVWEVFGPLTTGARLVVPLAGRLLDAGALVDHLVATEVTTVQVVPSSLEALLTHGDLGRADRLRHVFCGGEPLAAGLRRRFFDALDADLHHLYGPAEATIDTTVWTCRPDDDDRVTPIGRPVANALVSVADAAGRAVPADTVGELWIGGAGVAAGYLDSRATDDERFVTDPDRRRWYRTGDLARRRDDGVFEFVGRSDDQVKLRGVRTEPGEVEAALSSHPSVEAAAVVTAPADDGTPRLVAFVVPRDELPDLDDRLRGVLRTRVPETAIPAVIRAVGRLPVLSSGKRDRRALRHEARTILAAPREPVPPRDPTERLLLETWQALFDDASIGVEDDFFALGGHSLLAVRLVARIERDLGESIEVGDLLERRTVAAVAAQLRSRDDVVGSREPVTVVRSGRAGSPLFLLPGVAGSAWAYGELADALDDDRPVVALTTDGAGGPLAHGDLTDVARTAAAAVTKRCSDEPVHLGGWSMGAVTALAVAEVLVSRGVALAPLLLLDPPPLSPRFGLPRHLDGALARLADTTGAHAIRDLVGELERSARDRVTDDGAADGPLPGLDEVVRATSELADHEVRHLRPRLTAIVRNLAAMTEHRPAPVDAAAVLFVAREPTRTTERLTSTWAAHCRRGIDVVDVPGDHHTMLRAPHVAALATQLRDRLAAPSGTTAGAAR